MRTTINLDPALIEEVTKLTGERNRGKAVNKAMDEFVRHAKIERLIALAGNIDIEDNWEEMEKLELDKMARREW
jgi:Arc/MetJ family transcription regulator